MVRTTCKQALGPEHLGIMGFLSHCWIWGCLKIRAECPMLGVVSGLCAGVCTEATPFDGKPYIIFPVSRRKQDQWQGTQGVGSGV